MKRLAFITGLILVSLTVSVQAQSTVSSLEVVKLDSLTKLAQRLLNNNQPDSLYSLMGNSFKQEISLDKMKEVSGQLRNQLGKWVSSEPRGVKDGVARYKATFALAVIDFYISRDKEGKIETFLFKPLTN